MCIRDRLVAQLRALKEEQRAETLGRVLLRGLRPAYRGLVQTLHVHGVKC